MSQPKVPHHADAGQVNKQGRSHTYGDFDDDGLIDHVFGFPEAYAEAGSTVIVYGNGDIQEIHRGIPDYLEVSAIGDIRTIPRARTHLTW